MNKKDLNFFIFLQMVFFLGHFSFLLYKKKNGVKLPYLQKIKKQKHFFNIIGVVLCIKVVSLFSFSINFNGFCPN